MLDLRTTQAIAYQNAHQTRGLVFLLLLRKAKRACGQPLAHLTALFSRRNRRTKVYCASPQS